MSEWISKDELSNSPRDNACQMCFLVSLSVIRWCFDIGLGLGWVGSGVTLNQQRAIYSDDLGYSSCEGNRLLIYTVIIAEENDTDSRFAPRD